MTEEKWISLDDYLLLRRGSVIWGRSGVSFGDQYMKVLRANLTSYPITASPMYANGCPILPTDSGQLVYQRMVKRIVRP